MDKESNHCKVKAVVDTQKSRRRLLKSQFVSAESFRRKREKGASTTYKSGCFGSELPPFALQIYLLKVLLTIKILIKIVRNVNYETVHLGGKGRKMTGWPANYVADGFTPDV